MNEGKEWKDRKEEGWNTPQMAHFRKSKVSPIEQDEPVEMGWLLPYIYNFAELYSSTINSSLIKNITCSLIRKYE
uniref:Uncharacterized protein n=1 Tax=Setaria digitata TaxID=48799 RepID=A0A915PGK6_9BILA